MSISKDDEHWLALTAQRLCGGAEQVPATVVYQMGLLVMQVMRAGKTNAEPPAQPSASGIEAAIERAARQAKELAARDSAPVDEVDVVDED